MIDIINNREITDEIIQQSLENIEFYDEKYENAKREYEEERKFSSSFIGKLSGHERDFNKFLDMTFYEKMLKIAWSEHATLLWKSGKLMMSGYSNIDPQIILSLDSHDESS